VAVVLVTPPPAMAKFGSSYSHDCDTTIQAECVADNGYHKVYVHASGAYNTESRWAITMWDTEAHPLQMYEIAPPAIERDVEILLQNLSTMALAWTKCDSPATYGGSNANHTRWCRPQLFVWNTRWEADYYPTSDNKRYVACHELGHTIGLQHPRASETDPTCMKSATMSPKYIPSKKKPSQLEIDQVLGHYFP
jgi:hypothetical protein